MSDESTTMAAEPLRVEIWQEGKHQYAVRFSYGHPRDPYDGRRFMTLRSARRHAKRLVEQIRYRSLLVETVTPDE